MIVNLFFSWQLNVKQFLTSKKFLRHVLSFVSPISNYSAWTHLKKPTSIDIVFYEIVLKCFARLYTNVYIVYIIYSYLSLSLTRVLKCVA